MKLVFINPKEIRKMRATFALMSLTVVGIFELLKWLLYITCVALVILMLYRKVSIIVGVVFGVVLWIYARIIRIASYEIQEIEDGNLLFHNQKQLKKQS